MVPGMGPLPVPTGTGSGVVRGTEATTNTATPPPPQARLPAPRAASRSRNGGVTQRRGRAMSPAGRDRQPSHDLRDICHPSSTSVDQSVTGRRSGSSPAAAPRPAESPCAASTASAAMMMIMPMPSMSVGTSPAGSTPRPRRRRGSTGSPARRRRRERVQRVQPEEPGDCVGQHDGVGQAPGEPGGPLGTAAVGEHGQDDERDRPEQHLPCGQGEDVDRVLALHQLDDERARRPGEAAQHGEDAVRARPRAPTAARPARGRRRREPTASHCTPRRRSPRKTQARRRSQNGIV